MNDFKVIESECFQALQNHTLKAPPPAYRTRRSTSSNLSLPHTSEFPDYVVNGYCLLVGMLLGVIISAVGHLLWTVWDDLSLQMFSDMVWAIIWTQQRRE